MFLVTDVTGHVGRAVLAELANQPVAVRALLQEPVDLPVKAPNIEAVRTDPDDPTSLQRAVEGVEAVFLASQFSPHIAEAHLKIANAAKAAGCDRTTLFRWFQIPAFQKALREERAAGLRDAANKLQAQTTFAVDVLIGVLDPRVRAAQQGGK